MEIKISRKEKATLEKKLKGTDKKAYRCLLFDWKERKVTDWSAVPKRWLPSPLLLPFLSVSLSACSLTRLNRVVSELFSAKVISWATYQISWWKIGRMNPLRFFHVLMNLCRMGCLFSSRCTPKMCHFFASVRIVYELWVVYYRIWYSSSFFFIF